MSSAPLAATQIFTATGCVTVTDNYNHPLNVCFHASSRGHAKIYLRHAGRPVSDAELVAATAAELSAFAAAAPAPPGAALALVETAGGPASPGPSGRIQVACPALRPPRAH